MTAIGTAWIVAASVAAWPALRPVPGRAPQQNPPATAASTQSATTEAILPPGDGRDAVLFMCVPCHGIPTAVVNRRTAKGWQATVDDMREKGAQGSDDQAAAATSYLSRFFLAVDVNHASAEDITRVAHLSPADAAAIVAYRDAGHAFKSFADVAKVPGVDAAKLEAAKPKLVYAPR